MKILIQFQDSSKIPSLKINLGQKEQKTPQKHAFFAVSFLKFILIYYYTIFWHLMLNYKIKLSGINFGIGKGNKCINGDFLVLVYTPVNDNSFRTWTEPIRSAQTGASRLNPQNRIGTSAASGRRRRVKSRRRSDTRAIPRNRLGRAPTPTTSISSTYMHTRGDRTYSAINILKDLSNDHIIYRWCRIKLYSVINEASSWFNKHQWCMIVKMIGNL